jgi:hypothetical protein
LEFRLNALQLLMNELHPGILFILQFIQNMSVEGKEGQHGQAAFQRMVQGRIVFEAQVAAHPEYGNLLQELIRL